MRLYIEIKNKSVASADQLDIPNYNCYINILLNPNCITEAPLIQ